VLQVLSCWAQDGPELSLTRVAERTGLTLTTTQRMIKALQRENFLVSDGTPGKLRLGPAIMDLARVVLQRADQDELVLVALPHLKNVRRQTGETVGLHVPMGENRLCAAELVSRQPVHTATGIGKLVRLPNGAAGKILVAWSPERLEIALPEGTATQNGAPLDDDLAEVRRRGYAASYGETTSGASAVAVPIRGPNADVRAAINVTGPRERWTAEAIRAALPDIMAAADRISEQLGHRPTAPVNVEDLV
jgi:IclR family transcriptional regulator, acetate operon repressor